MEGGAGAASGGGLRWGEEGTGGDGAAPSTGLTPQSGTEAAPRWARRSQRVCRGGRQPLPDVDPGGQRGGVGLRGGSPLRTPSTAAPQEPRSHSPQPQGQRVAEQQRGDDEQQQLGAEEPLLPQHRAVPQRPPHRRGGTREGEVIPAGNGVRAGARGWRRDAGGRAAHFAQRCSGQRAQLRLSAADGRRSVRSASCGGSRGADGSGRDFGASFRSGGVCGRPGGGGSRSLTFAALSSSRAGEPHAGSALRTAPRRCTARQGAVRGRSGTHHPSAPSGSSCASSSIRSTSAWHEKGAGSQRSSTQEPAGGRQPRTARGRAAPPRPGALPETAGRPLCPPWLPVPPGPPGPRRTPSPHRLPPPPPRTPSSPPPAMAPRFPPFSAPARCRGSFGHVTAASPHVNKTAGIGGPRLKRAPAPPVGPARRRPPLPPLGRRGRRSALASPL